MAGLSKLYRQMAELIEQRAELSHQLNGMCRVDDNIVYWTEQLNDNKKLFISVKDENGETVEKDYTSEKKALESVILKSYITLEKHREYVADELNKADIAIKELETVISNHWMNRLNTWLFIHGWSHKLNIMY